MQEQATFAAGCFWGVEAAYRKLMRVGVLNTRVGYAGGSIENPTYEQVCTGTTGHAEAVEITYDSDQITYKQLLEIFWQIHDPTQKNRQGNDIGPQYRSVIFYHTDEQRDVAMAARDQMNTSGTYTQPVMTEIVPIKEFYEAEDYHQQYLEKNPGGYCHVDLDSIKVPQ